jgi:hypothetical protein
MIETSLGNTELLKLRKTAFLCSRDIPASVVLKCYDWAIEQRNSSNCVIGGFHSKIEKDVFHYLLAGKQPIIMALARGIKNSIEPEIKKAIDDGRLLLVTPFAEDVKQITASTAEIRNRFMIELADEVVIGFASKGGMLESMIANVRDKKILGIKE